MLAGLLFLLPERVHAQFPEVLVPKEAVIQYAGSIGYLSAGAGYHLFKNKRGSLDFHYGFVPKAKGGDLHIVSAKFAYRPVEIRLKKLGSIYPVNPGVFLSYHFGKEFDLHWDKSQYEEGYYWWSSALRPHLSISNELKLDAIKLLRGSKIRSVSIYSEFNTNELYLISYLQNMSGLHLTDIFKLGFGLKIGL